MEAKVSAPDRFDYDDKGNLDDVVVNDVTCFRLEYMDDNSVWLKCYRDGKDDVVIWLRSRGKITGHHDFD
jgi:hypothetical protein